MVLNSSLYYIRAKIETDFVYDKEHCLEIHKWKHKILLLKERAFALSPVMFYIQA